jgi:multimeric flavodoxin WrbA
MASLKAIAVNCTLKASPAESSCELLLSQILEQLGEHDVEGEIVRVVDLDVKPGVSSDEGKGDDWPSLRQRLLAADILLLGTPIWLDHPSSVCQQVLERLDAFLGEEDERGRIISYDRVAAVAVVGNEDGAHHVFAELAQGLSDDKSPTSEATATAIETLSRNAAHLAKALKAEP